MSRENPSCDGMEQCMLSDTLVFAMDHSLDPLYLDLPWLRPLLRPQTIAQTDKMAREGSFGVLNKVTETHFTWKIFSFFNIIKKADYAICNRNSFEFNGIRWYLKFSNSGKETDAFTSFCLVRHSVADSPPCAVTYRFYITGAEDKEYWTSPVLTEEFIYFQHSGTGQELLTSRLLRDANILESRIADDPGGVLHLHLMFYPPTEQTTPPEDVDTATDEPPTSNPRTTDVGTQTCLNLLCKDGCSSNANGVNLIEAQTTDGETQTCSNLQPKPSTSYGLNELLQNLEDLLLNGQKSDVTLNVKGSEFHVHKAFLVARSSVFSTMFEQDKMEQSSSSVQIPEFNPDTFYIFLHYLYTAKYEGITASNVVELYNISYQYNIKDLSTLCVNFMISNLCVESFCDFVSIAVHHCELELLECASTFFIENMKQIMTNGNWVAFVEKNPTAANEFWLRALDKGQFIHQNQK